jgi:hypothetical protein
MCQAVTASSSGRSRRFYRYVVTVHAGHRSRSSDHLIRDRACTDVTREYYACSNNYRRHVYLATTKHQDLFDEGDTPPFSSMDVNERALDLTAVAFIKTTCNPRVRTLGATTSCAGCA